MVDKWCSYWGRIEGMSLNISPTKGYKKVILRIWYPLIIHGSGVHCAPAPLMMDRAESSLYLIKCTDHWWPMRVLSPGIKVGCNHQSSFAPRGYEVLWLEDYGNSVCSDVFTVILSTWRRMWSFINIYTKRENDRKVEFWKLDLTHSETRKTGLELKKLLKTFWT